MHCSATLRPEWWEGWGTVLRKKEKILLFIQNFTSHYIFPIAASSLDAHMSLQIMTLFPTCSAYARIKTLTWCHLTHYRASPWRSQMNCSRTIYSTISSEVASSGRSHFLEELNRVFTSIEGILVSSGAQNGCLGLSSDICNFHSLDASTNGKQPGPHLSEESPMGRPCLLSRLGQCRFTCKWL